MTVLIFIFWCIATLLVCVFFKFFLLPYIKNKSMFWIMSRKLKQMSKKHDGELGEKIKEMAKTINEASKNEKLF